MDVNVKIESIHGDEEPIVSSYKGSWNAADGRQYISYRSGDMLTVKKDELIIDEAGEMRAHIVLRPDGQVRSTLFATPFGTMTFGIDTHYLRMAQIPGSLMIEAGYSLMAEQELVNDVSMTITVTAVSEFKK